MFNSKSPNNKGQQSVENSLHGLASMLALIAAFLVCPQIYEYTADPVYAYLLNAYQDESIAQFGMFIWVCLTTAAVFFLSRALIVLALILIAQRLLVFAF